MGEFISEAGFFQSVKLSLFVVKGNNLKFWRKNGTDKNHQFEKSRLDAIKNYFSFILEIN